MTINYEQNVAILKAQTYAQSSTFNYQNRYIIKAIVVDVSFTACVWLNMC